MCFIIAIKHRMLCAVVTLALSSPAVAEEITRQGAEALMQQCQSERQENIAPLKAQAIDDCINKQRRDREHCEQHNRNYGERTAGGRLPGMFWGLPVCENAVAAEKYFRMNPGRQVYAVP
jgi:hypothetical protein